MEPGPLAGLRVLDFTQNLPGPYATYALACLGADVIKVEPPKGDPGRWARPLFAAINRGKRSIVLDLREASSRPALEALVRRADVLVEGFRPGVMERLGADWPKARAWNPRLVYCSISAYGQEGPRRDLPGHDLNLQAIAGVSWLERDGRDRPHPLVLPIADFSTSLSAVAAMGIALVARGTTGEGRHLDVAMSDPVLSFTHTWATGVDLAAHARGAPVPEAVRERLAARLDRERLFAMPHYGLFRCRDGKWLAIGIVDERHFWEALCGALGMRPLAWLGLPARILAGPLIRRAVGLRLRTADRAAWLDRLAAAGVPASPVHTPSEALDDPQVRARGLVENEGLRPPIPGARVPAALAPDKGEHTAEILAELGLP